MNTKAIYPSPDVEVIAIYLQVTASLAEMLTDTFLMYRSESVFTETAKLALTRNNFNNGATGNAYEVLRTYGYYSDAVHVIEERIKTAVRLLDELTGQNYTVSYQARRG